MDKRISLLSLCLFVCIISYPQVTVSQADSAYNAGNYVEAIDLYENIAQEQGISAPLLYNLANSYLQAEDYGKAMLNYQRARKLDPSNREINANINYLKEKIDDANKAEQKGKRIKVTEDDRNFFENVHSSVAEDISSNRWATWGVIFFLLFSGCVAIYMFRTEVILRKIGFFGGIILLGASMICVTFAYMGAAAYDSREYGVITAYKTNLQIEPGNVGESKSGEVLTRGSKIRIISEETDAEGNVTWFKVRLNSDYIGWVRASDLEII